jgi:hypothetical protein
MKKPKRPDPKKDPLESKHPKNHQSCENLSDAERMTPITNPEL